MAELALTFRVEPPAEPASPAGGDANVAAAQSDPDDDGDTMAADRLCDRRHADAERMSWSAAATLVDPCYRHPSSPLSRNTTVPIPERTGMRSVRGDDDEHEGPWSPRDRLDSRRRRDVQLLPQCESAVSGSEAGLVPLLGAPLCLEPTEQHVSVFDLDEDLHSAAAADRHPLLDGASEASDSADVLARAETAQQGRLARLESGSPVFSPVFVSDGPWRSDHASSSVASRSQTQAPSRQK